MTMTTSEASIESTNPSLASLIPPSVLSVAPDSCTWKGATWLQIDHQARKSGESKIWHWGFEFVKEAEPDIHGWRCGVCVKTYISVLEGSSTSNAIRHLRLVHSINTDKIVPPKRTIKEVEDKALSQSKL
jgi:hypothetical protein